MKTYEDVVLSVLEQKLNHHADELSVEYKLSYDPAEDEVTCKIKNSEEAGTFSHVAGVIIQEEHRSVKFAFPTKL